MIGKYGLKTSIDVNAIVVLIHFTIIIVTIKITMPEFFYHSNF